MRKLRKQNGETIVEALVSVLIAALCFVALQTSIVTTAKINKKAMDENVPFNVSGQSNENITVTIHRTTSSTNISGITGYKTSGGYYYYEYQK